MDGLTFGPNYPHLERTWAGLKAKWPRLVTHLAQVEASDARPTLADLSIRAEDECRLPTCAPVFPLELNEIRRLEAKLGAEPTQTKGYYLHLRVHPTVEGLAPHYQTAILAHELAHLKDILLYGLHRYQLEYVRETTAAEYWNNRFERAARFIGAKRGVLAMAGLHPRFAARLAADYCDREAFLLPDYDELAADIRRIQRQRRRTTRTER